MGKRKTSSRQFAWLTLVYASVLLVWVLTSFKVAAATFLALVIAVNLVKPLTGRDKLFK